MKTKIFLELPESLIEVSSKLIGTTLHFHDGSSYAIDSFQRLVEVLLIEINLQFEN